MMSNGYGNMGWGSWLAMSLTMLILWGGLVVLVIWVARTVRPQAPASRADELLAERFARGEIEEDEFRRRRELLHSTAPRS